MTSCESIQPPWWFEPGAEGCAFCLHNQRHDAGYHCILCDRPICQACIVEMCTTHEAACRHCPPALAAQRNPGGDVSLTNTSDVMSTDSANPQHSSHAGITD